jgi:hypothetical protein
VLDREVHNLTVRISEADWRQLEDLLAGVQTGGKVGPSLEPGMTIPELTELILKAWADGYRRPGSWERVILERMGHVA